MDAPNHVDQPPPAAGHDPRDDDPTQLLTQLFAGATLGMPVDGTNHSDHRPPAPAAGASATASPTTTTGHDPGAAIVTVASSDGDGPLTRALTAMMAKPPLPRLSAARMMSIAQAATAKAAAASVPPTAGGRDPAAPPFYPRDNFTKILAELVGGGGTTLGTTRPVAAAPSSCLAVLRAEAAAAAGVSIPLDLSWTRAPAERQQPAGGHAGRVARRQRFRVPTDYLRARQDSRDRRHRRTLVRRCIRRVVFIHEDRDRERRVSAMMARLTTSLTSVAAAGDAFAAASAYAAAATSSTEDAGLAEQLDEMELSFKD